MTLQTLPGNEYGFSQKRTTRGEKYYNWKMESWKFTKMRRICNLYEIAHSLPKCNSSYSSAQFFVHISITSKQECTHKQKESSYIISEAKYKGVLVKIIYCFGQY